MGKGEGPKGDRVRLPHDSAFRVAFAYAGLASLWILLSDVVLGAVAPGAWERISIFKGLLFVTATSVALYLLVLRASQRAHEETQRAHAAERVLDQVVSTVPVGVVLLSSDELVTYMNPAAEALTGCAAAETVGRSFRDLLVDDDGLDATTVNLLNSEVPVRARLVGHDGGPGRAVLVQAARIDPAPLDSGRVLALSDVTDVHREAARSARELALSRHLIGSLLACNGEPDRAALVEQVVRQAVVSKAFRAAWGAVVDGRIAGLGRSTAAGLDDVAREVADTAARRLAGGESGTDRLAVEGVVITNDLRRDPVSIWYPLAEHGVGSAATLAVFGADGPVLVVAVFAAMPGFFDEATAEMLKTLLDALTLCVERISLNELRLAAEEQVEASEAGYRLLFDQHPLPMWVYDLETLRFLAVNDAAVAKYGWTRDEFLDMTIAQIRPPSDVGPLMGNVRKVSEGFEDAGLWTHIDSSGRRFPVHVYSHTIVWDGRPAELVMPQEVATVT